MGLTWGVVAMVGLGVLGVALEPSGAEGAADSPYRHQMDAEIRGMTSQEIAELRAGSGLARAAELNGFPGPRHVLDAVAAGQLELRADQLEAVRQIHQHMQSEAQRLGARLLDEERTLEGAFRSRAITAADLDARLARIAALQAELRAVHLRAHLTTRPLLSPEQLARYDEIRGYVPPVPPVAPGAHPHRH